MFQVLQSVSSLFCDIFMIISMVKYTLFSADSLRTSKPLIFGTNLSQRFMTWSHGFLVGILSLGIFTYCYSVLGH